MQRKNSNAFGLLSSIIFLIFIMIISIFIVRLGAINNTQILDNALYNQAKIYTLSSLEFAKMSINRFNFISQNECLEKINIFYPNDINPRFKSIINFRYIGKNLKGCKNQGILLYETDEDLDNFYIIIDIKTTSVFSNISYHKRVLERF